MKINLFRRGSSGAAALKFLGIKKGKKKTSSAIRDHKTSDALAILTHLSSHALKKKRPNEANWALLMAMANRMEDVALTMYERGIPGDVNSPIFVKQTKNSERGGISSMKFPSYFILSVALGLYKLTQAMFKRANVNQTWFGLSPLIILTAQTTPTSYAKSDSDAAILMKIFLEHGADPSQGLPYEQFNMLRRLKARKSNILSLAGSIKASHKSISRQFSSKHVKAEKVKEETKIYAKDKWVTPLDIAAVSGNIEIVKILLS
ncbi:9949_t:CDS:2, partial [Acaulospora morrowiae]